MDRNSQEITNVSVFTVFVFTAWSLLLVVLSLLTTLTLVPKAVAAPLDPLAAELSNAEEKINMEEMKIQGMVNKPNIMYVIPRADLKIDIKLQDDYFLLPSADPNENKNEAVLHSAAMDQPDKSNRVSLQEPLPFPSNLKSLFYFNNSQIREGSCISCHYSEIAFPKSGSNPLLLQALNQNCLRCHPCRYYHICWKEAGKAVSQLSGQKKGNCRTCHAPWMQPQGVQPQDAQQKKAPKWGSLPWGAARSWGGSQTRWIQPKEEQTPEYGSSEKGNDSDTFCITCHKH